ncbi:carbon monoxide dehydrogenase [Rhodopseudomonas boonkerdii]|uniref:FAD binding domain-containing protein n=1 Tax=Rhodopseudomonas boonkerdii TaxID=475937 RepID=UPI001E5929E7|nr:FAD binding domain-containing protein [Rhodopseudomonas boonkerdii]UGV26698.1 carbon monoxide dehydrogenase [Rhodopseudomonas boonkerdii]
MKPAPFTYERPRDIGSALSVMTGAESSVKIIAGGQSLGPMLNLRLVAPDTILDITGIAELKRADVDGNELMLGACVTHADIEDGRVPDVTRGAMQRVAANIAYRAVRNRGTVGGSLSHADPSADWVSSLAALGASLSLRSTSGTRRVAMKDFILGALESVMESGEMLEAVHVPLMPSSARWGYVKSCRKTGEFAHAIGAVLIDPDAGKARIVIGAVEAAPIIVEQADELFGGTIDGGFASRFDARVADKLLAEAGMADSADRHIHVAVLRKAVAEAA